MKFFFPFATAVLSAASSLAATIAPVADTFVNPQTPDGNFGGAGAMQVTASSNSKGNRQSAEVRSFLDRDRFQLPIRGGNVERFQRNPSTRHEFRDRRHAAQQCDLRQNCRGSFWRAVDAKRFVGGRHRQLPALQLPMVSPSIHCPTICRRATPPSARSCGLHQGTA